jgi:hypothetical protein
MVAVSEAGGRGWEMAGLTDDVACFKRPKMVSPTAPGGELHR